MYPVIRARVASPGQSWDEDEGPGPPPYVPSHRPPMTEEEVEAFFGVQRGEVPGFKHLYDVGAFDLLRDNAIEEPDLKHKPAEVAARARFYAAQWQDRFVVGP